MTSEYTSDEDVNIYLQMYPLIVRLIHTILIITHNTQSFTLSICLFERYVMPIIKTMLQFDHNLKKHIKWRMLESPFLVKDKIQA